MIDVVFPSRLIVLSHTTFSFRWGQTDRPCSPALRLSCVSRITASEVAALAHRQPTKAASAEVRLISAQKVRSDKPTGYQIITTHHNHYHHYHWHNIPDQRRQLQ